MALTAEQLALITIFRKENEDLVKKNVQVMFNIQAIEQVLSVGDNSVAIPGDAFDDTNYLIDPVYAIDADDVDVRGELEILEDNKTVNGFVVTAITPCTARFVVMRRTPKADFFTDG